MSAEAWAAMGESSRVAPDSEVVECEVYVEDVVACER